MGLRVGRTVSVIPQMSSVMRSLQRRLDEYRFDRLGDKEEIVMLLRVAIQSQSLGSTSHRIPVETTTLRSWRIP